MRAIEKAAIESGDVTGLELMERAGRGVVDAIFEEWPELAQAPQAERGASPPHPPEYLSSNEKDWVRRAVVLCGPGNNGGDGFVVARLLRERGWDVKVFLYGDPRKLPPDARVNYERWGEMGEVRGLAEFNPWKNRYDLGIDAVFGTGLSRAIDVEIAQKTNELDLVERTVSIDIPSGCCADSGRALLPETTSGDHPQIEARLTVTFQFAKCGHFSAEGAQLCGKLLVRDIGLPSKSALRVLGVWPGPQNNISKFDGTVLTKLTQRWWHEPGVSGPKSDLDKGYAEGGSHKYTHGHALILSGGLGKTGAARLAARAALRIGAGLVTVGSPGEALAESAAQLTAIMLRGVEDATALAETLKDDRINALCLGPGLGLDRARGLVPVALAGEGRAVVLDADALTAFSDAPAALFAMLHEHCVLTPHAGEFARFFPDIAEKLNAPATKGPAFSKVDATREAAKRAGCVVLFKGADTVIAQPDGRCSVNAALYERSAPWLATAGSGDVLAGFITGLLARGFGPTQAAETAAWLHVECALTFGPGLIAEDLPEQLPAVFRGLGLQAR